jgi:pyruvate formate lyase activating enzyme
VSTFSDTIDRLTVEGSLYTKTDDGSVRCYACAHRCLIRPGRRGICQVRYNQGGVLRVPWGYVAALQVDPIEKKPFSHVLPGTEALTFGMLGCDLHCGYCQNWVTSQALRDIRSTADFTSASPGQLVRLARQQGAAAMVSTYNEPLITAEWAVEVFREAKASGLTTAFVSNGNATPEVLDFIRPWVDLYKVDLKSFDDRRYHELGGRIGPILDSIRRIYEMGFCTRSASCTTSSRSAASRSNSPSTRWRGGCRAI